MKPALEQIRHNPLSGKLDVLHQRGPKVESLGVQKKTWMLSWYNEDSGISPGSHEIS